MTQEAYLFHDAQDAAELERLRLIESVFDEKTRQWLSSAGPLTGRRCFEVGAGAGSIADWLASQVGPAGATVAMDSNVRFLRRLQPRVRVIEGLLGPNSAPALDFDLVHARYVLIHNAEPGPIVDEMLRTLKPGGALLLEEPDFSAAKAFAGPAHLMQAFDRVTPAIRATFAARNMNYAFGSALPALLQERSVKVAAIDYDCPISPGSTPLAEMMRRSTLALREKYVATGLVSPSDIDDYAEFAVSPQCWGNYYATVRVLAHKS
jgi:ubiquinone/menaquinone biosynthesis C-methylase UbiE